MKSILNKLYPDHSTGNAIVISVFTLLTLLVGIVSLTDYLATGESYTATYVLMSAFTLIAASVSVFTRRR